MVFKNVQKTIVLLVLKTTHFSNDNHDVKRVGILGLRTYSQCLKITQNVALEFWPFPTNLVILKLTRLVTLFDRQL